MDVWKNTMLKLGWIRLETVEGIIIMHKKSVGINRGKMSKYGKETRDEIRSEERGETIACDEILKKLKALHNEQLD